MKMCQAALPAAAALALVLAAAAQPIPPASENVVVTAPKLAPDATITDFVHSYSAPAPMLDKIARWRRGICPIAVGLPPDRNDYVTARVKKVAALVGAPVRDGRCEPNIDIVFTNNPQLLLDGIRADHPELLGYHQKPDEAVLATVRYPIQAWYATETEDLVGERSIDGGKSSDGMLIAIPPMTSPGVRQVATTPTYMPGVHAARVSGFHNQDGLRSQFYHIVIVADAAVVGDRDIGPIADYIALLALAQTDSFDKCQTMPSIANLMAPDCDNARKPREIGEFDLAFLRALYRMDPGAQLTQQRSDMVRLIKEGLEHR